MNHLSQSLGLTNTEQPESRAIPFRTLIHLLSPSMSSLAVLFAPIEAGAVLKVDAAADKASAAADEVPIAPNTSSTLALQSMV